MGGATTALFKRDNGESRAAEAYNLGITESSKSLSWKQSSGNCNDNQNTIMSEWRHL